MLNDIRFHVNADESAQREQEKIFAQALNKREVKNFAAFTRYIPTIAKILPGLKYQRLSMFVDKNAQTNIVNLANGKALYTLPVDPNIQQQLDSWPFFSAYLNLLKANKQNADSHYAYQFTLGNANFEGLQAYASQMVYACQQATPDALVVLGLGKATFLPALLQQIPAKKIVIYEPDWEVFRCSVALFDWAQFLHNAEHQGVQIFLQIGDNITQIFQEISELHTHLGASRFIFFQHQVHELFNQVINRLRQGKWNASIAELNVKTDSPVLVNGHLVPAHASHHLHYFNSLNVNNLEVLEQKTPLFTANMALFSEHYPDIHEAFRDYTPQCWETIRHKVTQQINAVNCQHMCFFAGESGRDDGVEQATHFSQYPNLDGLAFGYHGDKLKHYMHNRFVRKVDLMLTEHKIDKGELPSKVKMLLVFGMGTGYMLEALYEKHDIQNLNICEPNPDFFYASLHAIDWAPIFEKVQENDYKLYINIGEASARLFKDLTYQFVNLGPHILNETYMMQAYDNPLLHNVLLEVRQQLQVIFSMCENLDHVLYGIAHTAQALQDKVPALRFNTDDIFSHRQKQIPIFIVGNGPSLDTSIAAIKEYQQQAIVVSCGTALQALHRNDIKPDFHAEVEQNRANFDWLGRIGDPAYLKKISLISVNGIHPDTYDLFKNAYMVFKAGESSALAALTMLPEGALATIQDAYPTVTNMILSLFLKMGFNQIYLHGVDLGFADQEKHHSAASGYYDTGKQVFEYKKIHEGLQRVKGNQETWVYTKTEFNISRMIFEQVLAEYKVECFNLSNGAFVAGTIALLPEDVLVVTSETEKQQTLVAFDNAFITLDDDVIELFNKAYSQERMQSQLVELTELTAKASSRRFDKKEQVEALIASLRDILVDAKRLGGSLFFYYFFNSVNYLNAVLSKAIMHPEKSVWQLNCRIILQDWNLLMSDFNSAIEHQFDILDIAECYSDKHEQWVLANSTKRGQVNYFCLSQAYREQCKANQREKPGQNTITVVANIELPANGYLIIDVLSEDEARQMLDMLISCPSFSPERAQQVAIVFHQYDLLKNIKKACANTPLKDLCFIYLPLIWEHQGLPGLTVLNSICASGYQDYLPCHEYFHFLQARAADFSRFSLILYKPRFNENGAFPENEQGEQGNKVTIDAVSTEMDAVSTEVANDLGAKVNANVNAMLYADIDDNRNVQAVAQNSAQVGKHENNCGLKIQRNIQFIENIQDFNHFYDEDFDFTSNNEVINKDILIKRFTIDANLQQSKNEFVAHAHAIVERKIIQHIDFDSYYSFKHYLAIEKSIAVSKSNVGLTGQPQAETDESITTLDDMQNRGLLTKRKPLAYELFGQWHLN